jgi:tetratricopeptide (TPR) repeat protein
LLATPGSADFIERRFDEAVPKLRLAIEEDPNFPDAYRLVVARYAQMGRREEAREVFARLGAITPLVVLRVGHPRSAAQPELFLSDRRLVAGEGADCAKS